MRVLNLSCPGAYCVILVFEFPAHADRYDLHVLRTGLESLIILAFLSLLPMLSSRILESLAALLTCRYVDCIVRSNYRDC